MGPGDHRIHEGQERICLTKVRDKHDVIFVEEKWDGSCVAVAMIDNALHPLGFLGVYHVYSPYETLLLYLTRIKCQADSSNRAPNPKGSRCKDKLITSITAAICSFSDPTVISSKSKLSFTITSDRIVAGHESS